MNYEKLYKERKARVLEIGRGYVQGVDFSKPRQIAEYIDPELKESEDEKIRKELIRAFTVTANKRDHEIYGNGITYGQVLVWLEKQGEQKLAEWSE